MTKKTDESLQQFASIAMRYLDKNGHENNSSESLIHETGLHAPLSLQERIRRMSYSERQMAYAMGDEQTDESDFDDDDDMEFMTPYEMDGYEHETPLQPPEEPPVVSETPKGKKTAKSETTPAVSPDDASTPSNEGEADLQT